MRNKAIWCALSLFAQLFISQAATADQKWFSVKEVCGNLQVDGSSPGSVTYSVLLAAAKHLPCCEGTKKVAEGKTDANGRFEVPDLQPGQYFFVAAVDSHKYVFPVWMDSVNKNYCTSSLDQSFRANSTTGETGITIEAHSYKSQ